MNGPATPKQFAPRRPRFYKASQSSFKSPLIHKPVAKTNDTDDNIPLDELKELVKVMWLKKEKLKKEVAELEKKYDPEQLKWHMAVMHRYNEVKDVAQMVFGRIAIIEGCTVKEVHEEFGMSAKD